MKNLKPFCACILITSLLSGCATLFNDGSQTIQARSGDNQAGVEVEVKAASSSYITELPTTIAFEPTSSDPVSVTVVDECYVGSQQLANRSITPSYWVNLLNGWGFLIDWVTGKMWKYDPNLTVPITKKPECQN